MLKKSKNKRPEELLFREAECKINRDNTRCLLVLAVVLLFCDLLNEIHVFDVAFVVMRIGIACGMMGYLVPVVFLCRPLRLFRRSDEGMVYRIWHKYLILAFAWLGTAASCITLTHHTVIVMAIPIMIMAQYRDTKRLVPITVLFGTICVLLGVYGGYFWGCFDANLLHLMITDDNAVDLALRAQMATPTRMVELLTHYALARELVVLSLILLASNISRRGDEMLRRQADLQSAVEQEMQRTNTIQWQIIDGMANLIENRDASTGGHVKRTSFYVKSIVDKLQADPRFSGELCGKRAETIVRAAPLHDIGKIIVADRILQKPGKLTPEEFEEIKLHSSEGARVIRNVLGNVEDEEFLRIAVEIAGGHHERWDSRGYPDGVGGEAIPLSARIMAVADVFDALVSRRVYKSPMPAEEAFAVIEGEAGKQFDPDVVQAFCSMKTQILAFLDSSCS